MGQNRSLKGKFKMHWTSGNENTSKFAAGHS